MRSNLKIRLHLYITFLTLVVILGCMKDEPVSYSSKRINFASSFHKDWSSIQNPNNPYNVVGEIHNNCLDYIAEQRRLDPDTTLSVNIEYVTEFFQDSSWYRLENGSGVPGGFLEHQKDSAEAYFYRLALNPSQQSFFDEILATLEDTTQEDFVTSLSQIENSILNSDLTESERGFPLLFVSLAKHSAAYWQSDTTTNVWPWLTSKKAQVGCGASGCAVSGIIETDAKWGLGGAIGGFLGGLVAGGLGGSLGGPAGTLGGAAGGAIIGSLAGGVSVGSTASFIHAIGG